jgi:hypothetical protein
MMNYHELILNDQNWNNWLLFTEHKKTPWLSIKPRYQHLLCPKCKKFDHDDAFKEGFDSEIRIRGRGDIIRTDDGFRCVNEKVKRTIERAHLKGLGLKPLGDTGWYVINVTLRVSGDSTVYRLHKPFCRHCNRPSEITGIWGFQSQLRPPKEGKSFFSTIFDRCCSGNADRDIFVTEDIVRLWKDHGVKGGMFERLLNADEEAQVRDSIARGKPRWPAQAKTKTYL